MEKRPLMLIDLPELLIASIFPFFLDSIDYNLYKYYDLGNKNIWRRKSKIDDDPMNLYPTVSQLFRRLVHKVTRDDFYICICQYLYLLKVIPNTRFKAGVEDNYNREVGDLVIFNIDPYDTSWCKWKSSDDFQITITNQDITGIAKILTLNKRYALGKVRLNSFYISKWLPKVLDLLSIMIKDDPQLSVNCEVIEIGEICDDCDQLHGFETEDGYDDLVDIEIITSFVHLVKKLSNNMCIFPNGICCIACSEINLYSRFERIGYDFGRNDIDALCHYCSVPILPNFKCNNCTTRCNCNTSDERYSCKNFVCSDCVEVNMINVDIGWTSPVCPNKSRQITV